MIALESGRWVCVLLDSYLSYTLLPTTTNPTTTPSYHPVLFFHYHYHHRYLSTSINSHHLSARMEPPPKKLTTQEALNRGLFTTEQLSRCVPNTALHLVKAARVRYSTTIRIYVHANQRFP
jgi:hypothetical protein